MEGGEAVELPLGEDEVGGEEVDGEGHLPGPREHGEEGHLQHAHSLKRAEKWRNIRKYIGIGKNLIREIQSVNNMCACS